MSARNDILNTLVAAVDSSGNFKKVYKGIVPPIPKIKSFPSVAFAISKENRERVNVPGCQFQSELHIIGMIYTRADKIDYTDEISDLLYVIEETVQSNANLNDLVIDIFVKQVTQDGGILYPYSLCELQIIAYYRK